MTHVDVCECTCMVTHVDACEHRWRPEVDRGIFLSCLPPFDFEIRSLNLELSFLPLGAQQLVTTPQDPPVSTSLAGHQSC